MKSRIDDRVAVLVVLVVVVPVLAALFGWGIYLAIEEIT